MKTQILLITVLFFSIGIVNALNIYSGENITIPLDFEIVNCSVTNSTYNLEGLNLSWHEKDIVISTSPYYQSDNLNISCWIIKYEEVIEQHYNLGEGPRGTSYNCEEYWQCTDWSVCANEIQTRTCQDLNKCRAENKKPIEKQACSEQETGEGTGELTIEQQALGQTTERAGLFSGITGAVTGALGNSGWLIIVIFISGIIGLSLSVRIIRKRKAG